MPVASSAANRILDSRVCAGYRGQIDRAGIDQGASAIQLPTSPRIPIKESDLRKKGFEDRHGEGAVELDALEALYPGELGRIVRHAVQPYFDEDLWERLQEADDEASDLADAEWEALIEEESEQLEELRAEADAISQQFSKRAAELKKDWEGTLEPLKERLEVIRHAVQEKAEQFQVDLPDRPEAAEADADESEWLFDSNREYLDQIECYRKYKGSARRRSNGDHGGGDHGHHHGGGGDRDDGSDRALEPPEGAE